MNIRQKMVLIVIGGILVSATTGSMLVYEFVKRNILINETTNLQKITTRFTSVATQRFSESEPKLKALAKLLESELEKPITKDEIKTFQRLFERNPDGVWRNQKLNFNGQFESGVFLPVQPKENDLQKIQHLRIKKIMDVFGASASKRFENIWYLSPERSEIIFDKTYPNFAFDQKADNDYTQTPWVTLTTPELNPNRELRFTPPLFDPVPQVWMVSAIYPIYVNNQWIGSLGEDMPLTGALEFMFSSEQLYKDTEHFLVDSQGNFVLAGSWQKQLESSSSEAVKNEFKENTSMIALFNKTLSPMPQLLSDGIELHNRRYIAIGMILEPFNWHYYLLAPVDEIMASTKSLFVNLAEMILFIGALNGFFIFTMTGQTITNRIQKLTNALRGYDANRELRISNDLKGTDEISQAAKAFDVMANAIDHNIYELNKRTEELQNVFDVSPSGYLLVNHVHQILLANKAACVITGLAASELLAMTKEQFLDYLSKNAKNPIASLKLKLKTTTELQRIEFVNSNTVFLCGRREIYLSDGSFLGVLYFLHDITKEEEANRIKTEFLTSATHELRTPLSTIHGYSELLNSGMIPIEMQPEIIDSIYQQSSWLISMITELLDLNRIEERAGSDFVFNSFELADLIKETISEFTIPDGREPVICLPVESITVNLDNAKFKQMLKNIIDNAYKYSPNGGDVTIEAKGNATENFVEIRISDTGLGLDEAELSRVFERFYRVDKSGNIPGFGLGLSLSKEIAHLLNGDIYIKSTLNQGSTVVIRLNLTH